MPTSNPAEESGNIAKFKISSNFKDYAVDLSAGVQEFNYYESVLSNVATATAIMIESGFQSDGSSTTAKESTLDGLPIRGGERTDITIADANGFELTYPGGMYVNRVRDSVPGTQQDFYSLDFASKEFFSNDLTRVMKRYEGKISDHVRSILTEVMEYEEELDIDTTALDYNFMGNTRKPFYVLTWLASRAVPEMSSEGGGNVIGGTAGYLFYQTREGYHFKSIDKLFTQDTVKKYIHNNATQSNLPDGYDAKILSYTIDSDIDLGNNLMLGQYNNTSLFFDFYAFNYVNRPFSLAEEQEDKITSAGTTPITETIAEEFTASPSRLMTHVLDVGTLPAGTDMISQLEHWKDQPAEATYKVADTMVQGIMRYNQLFTVKTNITIPGDFSLKAGDLVQCDFAELKGGESQEVNVETGGIYMIANVCHRITPDSTYTSLGLVRDSFGRKTQ